MLCKYHHIMLSNISFFLIWKTIPLNLCIGSSHSNHVQNDMNLLTLMTACKIILSAFYKSVYIYVYKLMCIFSRIEHFIFLTYLHHFYNMQYNGRVQKNWYCAISFGYSLSGIDRDFWLSKEWCLPYNKSIAWNIHWG